MEALLWGATGQARVVHEALGLLGIGVAVVCDNDSEAASPFDGVPIVHGPEGFRSWRTSNTGPIPCVVTIGGARGTDRLALQDFLTAAGLVPLTVVHPSAYVARGASVGEGSQVLAGSVVAVGARLGRAVIVNTGAVVDHECSLSDGVHIGPGAHLAGLVVVGEAAFVGVGASVLPRITIGAGAIVGAGAVVIRDVAPGETVVGNPARPTT